MSGGILRPGRWRRRLDLRRTIVPFRRAAVPRKGIDRAVEAARRARGSAPAPGRGGDGPERARGRRCGGERGPRRFPCLGHGCRRASFMRLRHLHPSCCSSHPRDMEGFCIVLLEAAAAGSPAIVRRDGGTAEAVVDRADGDSGSTGRPVSIARRSAGFRRCGPALPDGRRAVPGIASLELTAGTGSSPGWGLSGSVGRLPSSSLSQPCRRDREGLRAIAVQAVQLPRSSS